MHLDRGRGEGHNCLRQVRKTMSRLHPVDPSSQKHCSSLMSTLLARLGSTLYAITIVLDSQIGSDLLVATMQVGV